MSTSSKEKEAYDVKTFEKDGVTPPNKRWWSEEEDRRVRRKLDVHIVPWLFIAYVFAFLDRSNIGNAKVAGMNERLGLDDQQYRWLLTIFYIAYILSQPLLVFYKLVRPSRWMSACLIVWGFAALLQAAAHSWSGLMAARWFIAMAEAGFAGVPLFLSFFYPRNEVGTRFACFVVGSAFASAVGGSVAYAIQGAQDKLAIDSWRLLFIVEAAPTVVIGLLISFFMPDSIATAPFLTSAERDVAEARLYRSVLDRHQTRDRAGAQGLPHSSGDLSRIIRSHFDLRNGAEALRDPLSYLNASLLFIVNVSFSAIPVYLPQLLSQMGYTRLHAQGLSAPPYAVSFFLAVGMTYLADRTQRRFIYIAMMTALGIVGYFVLATVENNHARYAAVWLVVLGLFPSVPLLFSWLLVNATGESKKGVKLIIFGTVGQCGPVLGTRLFPDKQRPYYRKAMYINAALLVAALAIQTISAAYLHMLNRRKEKQFDQAQQTFGIAASGRLLQFHRLFDPGTPQGRNELHMRQVDIAENGERSIYYRYQL